LVSSTFTPDVVGDFGQFGGMFDITKLKEYEHPVLVSSTDSVGTKVKIACETGKNNTIGEDIVNHCVDDILVMGASPLFFLDYIGIAKLQPDIAKDIVAGLARSCKANGCVLIGGETAEMPDVYSQGDYDLVGTIVGVVERNNIIDGSTITPGDTIIGLRSNGLHTRKIVKEVVKKTYDFIFDATGKTFGEELLKPHRSYISILPFLKNGTIKGCAHITGGGFPDNADRILPGNCDAVISTGSWEPDAIFRFLQENGGVANEEMYRTFNMGIGMVLVSDKSRAETIMQSPELEMYNPVLIGSVRDGSGKVIMEW